MKDTKATLATQARKQPWTAPALRRIDAGSAESSHGAIPDGGGGNQAS